MYVLWVLLSVHTISSFPSRAFVSNATNAVTSNYVRFETVTTMRNLRGLFPIDDEQDLHRAANPSGSVDMVGAGGQTAYM